MGMKVFLSHSTKDKWLVTQLEIILSRNQINCYVAEEDVQPGSALWEKISANIRDSDCVLVVLTNDGNRSEMVNQEIATAHSLNKPIIPLVETGVQVKGVLGGREYIELDKRNPYGAINNAGAYLANFKTKLENQQAFTSLVIAGLMLWAFSQEK